MNQILYLNWTTYRPKKPGKYYITNIKNPSKKDILEINIYTESSIKSELGTLIALLSRNLLIFYTDYKYFSGPFKIFHSEG